MRTVLTLTLLLAGCAKERALAPKELDELAHLAVSSYEQPELAEYVEGIASWLADNAESEEAWEGLRLTNLTQEDVADIDYPAGTELKAHAGLANAARSRFDLYAHASLIVEPDQRWTDPKTFDRYRRTLLEGQAAAFSEGEGVARTNNNIIKSGAFGVTIPYMLRKDYRWVALSDGTDAVVARAWIEKPGCSDNGKNCVKQSWGLEVFHGYAEGRSRRLYAVWIDVRTEADAFISDDGKIGLMANGNQDILEATEEELAARGF